MNANKKLSIIIPCYNAEKYLPTLLQNLRNQVGNREDIEVIIINDGSTDNSSNILNSARESFLKVISQKNGGPAVARNSGLDVAKGEYIWFVDVDDNIKTDAIAILSREIEKEASDVILFNYQEMDEEGRLMNVVRDYGYNYGVVSTGIEAYVHNNIPSFLWNRIMRREVIENNKIRFDTDPEDEDFLFTTYFAIKSLRIISDVLYYYRVLLVSHSHLNVNSYVNYYKGYFKIFDKNRKHLVSCTDNLFWTKWVFNICKNLAINYNRGRLLGGAFPDSRCAYHRKVREIIKEYQACGRANEGAYATKLKLFVYLPMLVDVMVTLKYMIKYRRL